MKKILNILIICMFLLIVSVNISADDNILSEVEIGEILMGDADNNGKINAKDALKLLKIVSKIESMDNLFSIRKNDYNHDYIIDAEDALHILEIAAKIEVSEIIEDPNHFFRDVEYKDGYPVHDYISRNIETNEDYSIDYGKMDSTNWIIELSSIENGVIISRKYINYLKNNELLLRYYWNVTWFFQDIIKNNEYQKTNLLINDFYSKNKSSFSNSFEIIVKAGAKCHTSSPMRIRLFITENDELYFIVSRRYDYFFDSAYSNVYKFQGLLSEWLEYDNLASCFEN